ncbi:hypothetical protein [uncultured Salinisphaera sp.]|uniref:hypothetical protein n=1 Tax=uncultured Salinisphaera sp. TaxID=359372 RepID=UPI0032B30E02
MIDFFERSHFLDYEVLRPLSHIRAHWELSSGYDGCHFEIEEDSFAKELGELIDELEETSIPARYHDNEDRLAEYVREKFKQEINKVGNRWVGNDYRIILQDAGILDIDEKNLVQSAKGRIVAAQKRNQNHYDDMEPGHRKMLGVILTLILFHRADNA